MYSGPTSTKVQRTQLVTPTTVSSQRVYRGRPAVHPLILTKPAKNSSSLLTIIGKSPVQGQGAAFFCGGIIYPEQEYSQQNYLLYWLLDGEMGLPGCTSQNEIGRSFKACGKTHIKHVANFILKPQNCWRSYASASVSL